MKKWQKEIITRMVADVVRDCASGSNKPNRRELKKLAKAAAESVICGVKAVNAAN